jgi:hypothetical protein
MPSVRFLSDAWLDALDAAARARSAGDGDPMAGLSLVVEQVVREGPTWRLVVDHGAMRVEHGPSDQHPDVRLTSDRDTAAAIASGRRAALDAFMRGDLVIGGDIRSLLDHREAFEALGDLFAGVREATDFW